MLEMTSHDRVAIERYLRLTHQNLLRELPLPTDKKVTRLTQQTKLKAAYVPVPYQVRAAEYSPAREGDGDPVDQLTASLVDSGERVLVIGEPGMGKSVVMNTVFAELADSFLSDKESPLPVYVKLAALDASDTLPGERSQVVWPPLLREVSESTRQKLLDRRQVIFLLDGLDELPTFKGSASDASIWQRLASTMEYPTAISCRESYHALKVAGSDFAYEFSERLELLPLNFQDQVAPYTRLYCQAMERPDLADRIANGLKNNAYLRAVLSRPLMLSMTVSVVFEEYVEAERRETGRIEDALDLTGSNFLTAEIYRKFIHRWLIREQRKEQPNPTAPQTQPQEKQEILERIAWSIFTNSKSLRSGYGSFRLADLIIPETRVREIVASWGDKHGRDYSAKQVGAVAREITERTFLINSSGRSGFQFAHKSFFEFMLASHVYSSLTRPMTDSALAVLLAIPLPDEVIDFLREILHWAAVGQDGVERLANVRSNLVNAIRNLPQANSTLMPRQQAANLAPIVADPATRQEIRQIARKQHAFIFRAIAVGEALHHHDSTMLDEFLERMNVDPIAVSFHMGYNRIYYGDQALTADSFRDDGGGACGSFFKNCLRHLTMQPRADGSVPYFAVRSQALASIRIMLEDPVRARRLNAEERPALEELHKLCSSPDPDQSGEYETQRKRLCLVLARLLGVIETV